MDVMGEGFKRGIAAELGRGGFARVVGRLLHLSVGTIGHQGKAYETALSMGINCSRHQ
jgi:hypothetical protein